MINIAPAQALQVMGTPQTCQASVAMKQSLRNRVHTTLLAARRSRGVSFKAIAFALVGVVNTALDYCVFLTARVLLDRWPAALAFFGSASNFCQCGNATTISLIAANTASWIVAVSGSYIMNSTFTFAAESGRKLRWSAYFAFVGSGVAGWLANTATLLAAAELLLLPVWLAKLLAVLASFVVNFSLSNFVVFRPRAVLGG
jgi:putative flippase GtrA